MSSDSEEDGGSLNINEDGNQFHDNKHSGKKELVWLNVSSTVGKDVPECKKKWKYLRDNFNKVIKKKNGKSGKSEKNEKQWEYFEMLNFLKRFVIANTESSGNLEKTPAPDETTNRRD
ncbi:Transcription factor Adf-1 [Folsomia candida]|uniref:Transcription factor Adf-1 n=1 Tax=Folsomia candida TaxID=158441 RepID=A0A226DB71_FOLCA|nr:Transcription factor Adf-1 [Folsomia candida]